MKVVGPEPWAWDGRGQRHIGRQGWTKQRLCPQADGKPLKGMKAGGPFSVARARTGGEGKVGKVR